jgi:hypothetical protein
MRARPARLAGVLRARFAALLRSVADRLDPCPLAPALAAAAVPAALAPTSAERTIPLHEALAQLNLVKADALLRDALRPRNPQQAVTS